MTHIIHSKLLPLAGAVLIVVTLAACQSELSQDPVAVETGECDADSLMHLIGQPLMVFEALNYHGSHRVIRPRQAVTMDYRLDRLNVVLDKGDVIIEVNCS